MKPYYCDDNVVLYNADCRQSVALSESFDLLLTDPPYGIASNRKRSGGKRGTMLAACRDSGDLSWDKTPPAQWLLQCVLEKAQWSVVWGGNFFGLPANRCWLVWDKDNGANLYADCELAWTNFDMPVRKIRHRWSGMLQEPGSAKEIRLHPTQKPLRVMKWAMSLAPNNSTVFDPFAGSGTTLLAAKIIGSKAVGFETNEEYCEIAAKRLQTNVQVEMIA